SAIRRSGLPCAQRRRTRKWRAWSACASTGCWRWAGAWPPRPQAWRACWSPPRGVVLGAEVRAGRGIMVAHIVYLDPNMMGGILLYAFASALFGGIGNPGGAVIGGFIVGVLENMVAYVGNMIEKETGVYIIGNGEKLTVALIIVIFVLTVNPAGLFGRVVVKRGYDA